MKKFIKNNIKLIMGLILGLILSEITVTAASVILYSSDQVSYNPTDSEFDVTNVQEALNKLYDYHKYIGNMSSSNCVSGVYEHKANTQININIGFEAKIAFFAFERSANDYIYTMYNGYISNNVYSLTNLTPSKSNVTIGSNIKSSYGTTGSTYKNVYNVYYLSCK